jgi:hypothetical protein
VTVTTTALPSGALRHESGVPASALPAVRPAALEAAWEAARASAEAGLWGPARLIAFQDGVEIALTDADAACWAEAMAQRRGLNSLGDLALCLRLAVIFYRSRRTLKLPRLRLARKSKGWARAASNRPAAEVKARELSAELYGVFPELRDGQLPIYESSGNDDADARTAIRELLMGASLVVTKEAIATGLTVKELGVKKKLLEGEELEHTLDLRAMTELGVPGGHGLPGGG